MLGSLHATRPADVSAAEWAGLFEFVAWKLALLVGPSALLAFADDLLHPSRFANLRLDP